MNGLSIQVTASGLRAPKRLAAEGMSGGGATEPSFDFGGTVPRKVVAVNGLSIPVTDSSLSELKYSVAEDVNEGRSSWMTAQIF